MVVDSFTAMIEIERQEAIQYKWETIGRIREMLQCETIRLNKLHDDYVGYFVQADAFVTLSRDNKRVEEIDLCLSPDPEDAHRYAIWDKIAEAIGNLKALQTISIQDTSGIDNNEEDVPDWEILACILRRLRRGIYLRMEDGAPRTWGETLPDFFKVIHGQAMITGFCTGNAFPFRCLDILCSTLLTLPALESLSFEQDDGEGPEEGQSLESLVKLLKSPSLREVEFDYIDFTNTLCQVVARSEITALRFGKCSFPEGGSSAIARALKTNTTLEFLDFDEGIDEGFCEVLATALLSNSTLQTLHLCTPAGSGYITGSSLWLSPLFLALRVNSGLKELSIYGIDLNDEKLSTAIRLGLGNNSTLETLNLTNIKSGDNDTCLWREALYFLRTNSALKTLYMHFEKNERDSGATAIRMEVLAALRENESLEKFSLMSDDVELEDFLLFVAAIHPNTTLKSIQLNDEDFCVDECHFCVDECQDCKDLIPVLKKNYGLEEIPGLHHGAGDVNSILQLNRAGRRYLVQDGSSISKGIAVLSRVNNDINSVFLHLLENPRLCDRGAIETSSRSIGNMDNARSTPSPGNHSGGKREQQAPSQRDTEPRRRLE
jgi:hypothetical protein